MTASEFAFLALGLVLGVAGGAALVDMFRKPGHPENARSGSRLLRTPSPAHGHDPRR